MVVILSTVPTLHFIIPVFNEQATLAECLARVRLAPKPEGWELRVIVINDGSTDGTTGILEDQKYWATVLTHSRNRGKGAAVRSGFNMLFDPSNPDHVEYDDADVVIIQDADMEYDPADYPALLEPIISKRSQVVFGSRFGNHRPCRGSRQRVHAWGNRVLTRLSNLSTGRHLSDMECCYKLLTMEIAKRVFPMLSENGFGIEPQMTAALVRIDQPIVEVPIQYSPRGFEHGKKIKWHDAVRAVYVIVREWWITRFRSDVSDQGDR